MGSRFIKQKGFLVRISIDWGTKGNQKLQEILGVYFIHTLVNAINLESHWNAFSKASLAKFYFIKDPTVRLKHKLHSWSIQGRENWREKQRHMLAIAQDKKPQFPCLDVHKYWQPTCVSDFIL